MSAPRVIRVRAIPESRPPECHLTHAELMASQEPTPYIQDALAVDFTLATDEQIFGHQRTRRRDLPEPQQWAGQLARAVVEVLAGTRSPAQLVRWTTPEVYAVLARRHALAQRRAAEAAERRVASGPSRPAIPRRRPAAVRRVLVCEPADGVAEASVVVVDGRRIRAMAMRMVGQDGRWRLTVLHVG